VHAFDDTPGVARGNSFAIYKGLQWAADNGARIVNMSFAGPVDPTLQRLLAAAYDKGIVLVAAAGNAGPKSDPLYPAADPNVIAVTATDSDDHLFQMANRGRHIAVAAPGVDIFALAPGDEYVFTTGTSIAAAHVSGIVALLLEHKPSLKPGEIRAALTATAQPLGPPRPDSDFGAGLVNAYRAVMWLRSPPAPADGGTQAKQ
jgi:subtilisin family serine protease